jgi:hypothetical protein
VAPDAEIEWSQVTLTWTGLINDPLSNVNLPLIVNTTYPAKL